MYKKLLIIPCVHITVHIPVFVIVFNHNFILHIENIIFSQGTQKEKVSKKGNLQYVILVFLPQHRGRYFAFQATLFLGFFTEKNTN